MSALSKVGPGCCDFQIKSDYANFCARSMEFPEPLDSKIQVYTRSMQCQSRAPGGSEGINWTSKYGFIGITALNQDMIDEGMNEKGLSFGALTLNATQYPTVPDTERHLALSQLDIGKWILGSFATVQEVREALPTVRIWGEGVKELEKVPLIHVALHDKEGNNLVIEFIDWEPVIHDNPLGILTNDPPFDWQLTHVGDYNHLTPEISPDVVINGAKVSASGIGTGMIGLPGDWTSITRFVRIATILRNTLPPKSETEAFTAARHILNAVDIPKGVVKAQEPNGTFYESTLWTTIKDLWNGIFYYSSYNDPAPKAIDLGKIDFKFGSKHNSIKIEEAKPTIVDVTGKLGKTKLEEIIDIFK